MQSRVVGSDASLSEGLEEHLHNVRVFLAVANMQSIAQAAKQLFKAPSAVSRSIADLERSLGVPLFERNGRGILLHDHGTTVLIRARRIDAEITRAVAELSAEKPSGKSLSAGAIKQLLYNGRKLGLLVHLVDTQKISLAATRMGMTQSGASMALARIEDALGVALFRRRVPGMVPTEAADRLAMRAKRVFAELRSMLSDISAASGDLAGSVVVGVLPLGRTHFLPLAVAKALAQHPGIHVATVENTFAQLLAGLRSGNIDVIVGVPRDNIQWQGMTVEPLFTDRLAVVARSGHPLARKGPLRLSDLRDEKWILPLSTSPSRWLFEACYEKEGLRPPVPTVKSADLGVLRQLLIVSDMVAVASRRQLAFELGSGLLTELPVQLDDMTREVSLILREGAMLSPSALALLDALRSQASVE